MIEQQRQRVEHEVTRLVDDMDKTFLRKMQVSKIEICRDVAAFINIHCNFSKICIYVRRTVVVINQVAWIQFKDV